MPFTPVEAVLGGLAIGLTVFWNARLNGAVTGISGELGRALRGSASSTAFITGLISSGIVLKRVFPSLFAVDALSVVQTPAIIVAAFLVGFGTKLGNGCTSGHGVCGLSRFSFRSLVSTLTFMSTGMITATCMSSLSQYQNTLDLLKSPGDRTESLLPKDFSWMISIVAVASSLPFILGLLCRHARKDSDHKMILRQSIQYVLGLCFGGGLVVSGMVMPYKTVAFLDLHSDSWDPSVVFVFVGALPVAVAGFQPIIHGTKPVLTNAHSLPKSTKVDMRLVVGAVLFGIGWGLLGLCPGPAMVYLGAFPRTLNILVFCASLVVGNVAGQLVIDAL